MRTRGGGGGGISGGADREARKKKGGRSVAEASGAAAADQVLTMDVEQSVIRFAVRMISLSDEARRRFFAAPVGEAAVASSAKRVIAYALDMLEGAIAVGATQ